MKPRNHGRDGVKMWRICTTLIEMRIGGLVDNTSLEFGGRRELWSLGDESEQRQQ